MRKQSILHPHSSWPVAKKCVGTNREEAKCHSPSGPDMHDPETKETALLVKMLEPGWNWHSRCRKPLSLSGARSPDVTDPRKRAAPSIPGSPISGKFCCLLRGLSDKVMIKWSPNRDFISEKCVHISQDTKVCNHTSKNST